MRPRSARPTQTLLALLAVAGLSACDGDDGTPIEALEPLVVVAGQTLIDPAQVVISQVDVPADGWLAIHEDTGAGSFDGPIGFAAVRAGSNHDLTVTLSRDAVDGETLYAMLHVEAGEIGAFEFPGPDVPWFADGGAPIAPSFEVSVPLP